MCGQCSSRKGVDGKIELLSCAVKDPLFQGLDVISPEIIHPFDLLMTKVVPTTTVPVAQEKAAGFSGLPSPV